MKSIEGLEKLKQNNKDGTHLFDDELLEIIENSLKALEIIVKRECIFKGLTEVSQDEYDLLKEYLK